MERKAIFSDCGTYRYGLWRVWDGEMPAILFIALNPSTGDAHQDDPTIRRCIRFAQDWGYGSLCVGNLFSYRAVRPQAIPKNKSAIGEANDQWLQKMGEGSATIVTCWGNWGQKLAPHRIATVLSLFPRPIYHLGLTKLKQPKHPLYLPQTTKIQPQEMK
jgi:hypothetical protein